jgi:hypothetical protein
VRRLSSEVPENARQHFSALATSKFHWGFMKRMGASGEGAFRVSWGPYQRCLRTRSVQWIFVKGPLWLHWLNRIFA